MNYNRCYEIFLFFILCNVSVNASGSKRIDDVDAKILSMTSEYMESVNFLDWQFCRLFDRIENDHIGHFG